MPGEGDTMIPPFQPTVDLSEKIRFLGSPQAYPHRPQQVSVIETHTSVVFLAGELVYKLKKPVRFPFLDFTTLAARERDCETELRLNRRLAGDVYRRLLALRRSSTGQLTFDSGGEVVEWLIEMQRLPASEMLDNRLAEGRVGTDDVVRVGETLGRFYAAAEPQIRDGGAYLRHLEEESAVNRQLLMHTECSVRSERTQSILDRVARLMQHWSPVILERIADGRIVEGHGDLRPEHVCLLDHPKIIDCLEFDRNMRLLDPYDEVNYLGLECEKVGAGWIRPLLLATLEEVLGGKPDPRLIATYGAFRGVLRARICVAHMLDPEPMTPERWPSEARAYLSLAEEECLRAEG